MQTLECDILRCANRAQRTGCRSRLLYFADDFIRALSLRHLRRGALHRFCGDDPDPEISAQGRAHFEPHGRKGFGVAGRRSGAARLGLESSPRHVLHVGTCLGRAPLLPASARSPRLTDIETGRAARQRVESYYSIEQEVVAHMALYEEISSER